MKCKGMMENLNNIKLYIILITLYIYNYNTGIPISNETVNNVKPRLFIYCKWYKTKLFDIWFPQTLKICINNEEY